MKRGVASSSFAINIHHTCTYVHIFVIQYSKRFHIPVHRMKAECGIHGGVVKQIPRHVLLNRYPAYPSGLVPKAILFRRVSLSTLQRVEKYLLQRTRE